MKIPRRHIINGGFLLGAVIGSNFLNFLFNALLGRWLSFADFGLVTLILTFYSISSIFTNALASTINFAISKLDRDNRKKDQPEFLRQVLRKSVLPLVITSALWVIATPILMEFFQVSSPFPFLTFIPIVIFSVFVYALIGYYQGRLEFFSTSIVMLSEPITKVLSGVALAILGFGTFVYTSIPFSLLIAAVVGFFVRSFHQRKKIVTERREQRFPTQFFVTSSVIGIGSTLFFTVDLLLVRHFFSPELSGQYSLISLIGKMMFFFSILLNIFTLPVVTRSKGKDKKNQLFLLLFSGTFILVLFAWLSLGVFGNITVPLLLGQKSLSILSVLPVYSLGIGLYALSSVIASFHLAHQEYIFSYPLTGAGVLAGLLILVRHSDFSQITYNIAFTCFLLLTCLILMHIFYKGKEQKL
ncbi:MAG: oligosaccharide flippase family protein [Candidatus Woesebacteria bacterium]